MKETEKVVLDILKVRNEVNKLGGRKFVALSKNAKNAILLKKISRSFFRRLRTKYPELKMSAPRKVDVNQGLNVSREMAVEYLDDLAEEINYAGVGNLTYIEPGVWKGTIDLLCVICHDETPQFINHGESSFTQKNSFWCEG